MKKIYYLILVTLLLLPLHVSAAGSASISGASSVEVNKKITITVNLKNTAAWNIRIISSGSTSGCSQTFADATSNGKNTTKNLSVTCKATSIGNIGFTVTGDITSADGTNTNVSLTKRVTVTPEREKSADATLSSLTIEGYELNPIFNKDTLNYTVNVPSTVNTIKLDAKVNESHASLTGIGEFEVTDGMNTFPIVVTAETGTQITYNVNVNVEDKNPIVVTIKDEKYTIIKNAKTLTNPNLFEPTTIKINDFDIPAFYSDVSKLTLVGLKDEEGNINLAIYKADTNEYEIYNEFSSSSIHIYFADFKEEIKDYQKTLVKINDKDVMAYKYNENSRFAIVYGMNLETGEYNYYKFDTENETLQIWDKEEINELQKTVQTYLYGCFIFGGGLVFAIILIIYLLIKKKGKNKVEKKKQKETNEEEMFDLLKEKNDKN